MNDIEIQLVIGALLHDVGKVIYRQGDDRRKHSQSGYDYLKNEIGLDNKSILNSVLYHHADLLKNSKLDENDLSYIVYISDNIASAADRRAKEAEDTGFEIATPLQSVFNILNGNQQEMYYQPRMLNPKEDINYPQTEKIPFDDFFYTKVKQNITDNLKGIDFNNEYINSLLEVLEATLSYVPSSTSKGELADVSLYDHVKLTAAVSSCIYQYLQAERIDNYRNELFINSKQFYEKNAFILFSMDISGIQDFIYTISSKNALKTLRARSFYLEIMMEHMIDCILDKLNVTRANLIYSGGGHCYILLPNTKQIIEETQEYMDQVNQWLLDTFDVAMYVASGYAVCSCASLKNEPNGSYSEIFRTISNSLSERKSHRYDAKKILYLNHLQYSDYSRECKVCKKIGDVDDNGVCSICKAIEDLSKKILFDSFFTVILEHRENSLPLPNGYYLISDNEKSIKDRMQNDTYFVRTYGKNEMFTGKHVSTKLWVGSYTIGKTFEEIAKNAEGIERLGILRADVDNLGQTFVGGFCNEVNQNRYVTLSRTATLSRQLSLFFKLYINKILKEPEYSLTGKQLNKRNATIVYSGGDDLFIVGAWNEIIELAIDIRKKFAQYTQGTLTLSAGIGIYNAGYPISASAREVAELEEQAKKLPGKNAVTVFPDGCSHEVQNIQQKSIVQINDGTYSWNEFEEELLLDKYKAIKQFFDFSKERGKAFLYYLLELIRNQDERINFARYVYILARLEPDIKAPQEEKQAYQEFAKKMYQWIQNEKDRRELKTAMNMYAYLTREKEE